MVLGLGPDYVAEAPPVPTSSAELHTTFRRELAVDNRGSGHGAKLIDCDTKRIHAYLEVHHLDEGWAAAGCELLILHVDLATRKVAPFPDDVRLNLAAMKAAHGRLPKPGQRWAASISLAGETCALARHPAVSAGTGRGSGDLRRCPRPVAGAERMELSFAQRVHLELVLLRGGRGSGPARRASC